MLPNPPAVRTGLGKPRWDVLAFRHHPLQEGADGEMGGGIVGIEAPLQQAQGGEVVPVPSRCSTSGVTKAEWVRVQGLQGHLHAPSFNFHLDSLQTGQPL